MSNSAIESESIGWKDGGHDLALSGLKVVEFGAYAAGPFIGKLLGNFGATVVHVESRRRPDGFRVQYPPYKDNIYGLNRSGCFAICNDSKYAVTLDLKKPGAVQVARRLAVWADVIIENMTPGTIGRLGLGYEELAPLNPGLVMLSTCNMGQTGPRAEHPGFGSQLSALSGFTHLTGQPDGPPQVLYGPYIDFIAVAYGAAAILAALDLRRRTGRGQLIDLSQYECGVQFIADTLLNYQVDHRVPSRQGNRDPIAVPHGAYPCRDGNWCAISCWDDAEWQRLCQATGREDWDAPRFATATDRRRHENELDELLSLWTREQETAALMKLLQEHRVHAAAVNTIRDLFFDPQLAHRGLWRALNHPEIGLNHYRVHSFHLTETPAEVSLPAPGLGQHNEHVYREILGMTEDEYADLSARGVFD